jgi:CarD family transcriptional regulator
MITSIDEQEVAGLKLELFVISFEQDKMTLRVPTAKINSGDLIAISEVVRDLYRSDDQPEQSYSERQLFEQAMDRMSREIGAVNKLTLTEAVQLIEKNLAKSPRRGPKIEPDAEEAAA